MNETFKKYFGPDVPVDEQIFYMATLLSSGFSMLFAYVGFLVKLRTAILLLFASVCVLGSILFFLERRFHKTKLFSYIFLISCNFAILPSIMLLTDKNTLEIPIYWIIGITYALMLFDGIERVIYCVCQVAFDLFVAYYCFVIRVGLSDGNMYGSLALLDYVRLAISIVTTAILCGSVIGHRNRLLFTQIKQQQEATQTAERVSYSKDMFLVNVSHDIRTPLNSIIGTTDMLLDSDCNNRIREMAFNISNSSRALLSITSDLLDFSRMNIEDVLTVNKDKYDISVMINDIINLISVRLLDSNVEFYVNINPLLPRYLIGDSGKIRQILINLLSNAVKYTQAGHMTLKVDFAYEGREKVHLYISVEDTGIGIKPENIESIFAPNNTTDDSADISFDGGGLGLALCRKLTTAMDGTIFAESVYGEGSTFYFEVLQELEIPYSGGNIGTIKYDDTYICYYTAQTSDSDEIGRTLTAMELESVEAINDIDFLEKCKDSKYSYYFVDTTTYERLQIELNDLGIDWKKIVVISGCNYSYSGEPFELVLTRPISCLNVADLINRTQNFSVLRQAFEGKFSIPNATVLIIDDNLVNLGVTASMLGRYSPRVITAASGREGINTIQDEQVDIVYLDYMMPEMDGIDTLNIIRKMDGEKYKGLPVIALTANVVSGAREMFIDAGFDDYIPKPVDVDKLEKTLLEFLPGELIKHTIV